MSAERHPVLTDDEIEMTSPGNLRAAYRALRDRHMRKTIDLVVRIDRMRPVYERALDWRMHVTLAPPNEYTARLITAIDTALAAEVQD